MMRNSEANRNITEEQVKALKSLEAVQEHGIYTMNRETIKLKAIATMERLKISPDVIQKFRKDDKISVYIPASDRFMEPTLEQHRIIQKLESSEYHYRVYFGIQENIPVSKGVTIRMDSFLYTNEEIALLEILEPEIYDVHCACAYTYNYAVPEYSDHSDLYVEQTPSGGLKR